MKQLLEKMGDELKKGRAVMLAIIVARNGSAPRGVGTAMAVLEDGSLAGTIGGGSMEYRAGRDAFALLKERRCGLNEYVIHADDHAVTSGSVRVLFRPVFGEAGNELVYDMQKSLENGEESYFVCALDEDGESSPCVLEAGALCERTGLNDAPEQPVCTQGERACLVLPLREQPRVILFGGGHVAQVMARQLDLLDCRVWVVEDREEFAKEALFPTAERVIRSDYEQAKKLVEPGERDSIIVMSRGHETDYQILRWTLKTDAAYIGCIGSRRKIALTKERLLKDGLTTEQIEKMHAPIGLAIGAETPAEIAVSVAAELIACRAGK